MQVKLAAVLSLFILVSAPTGHPRFPLPTPILSEKNHRYNTFPQKFGFTTHYQSSASPQKFDYTHTSQVLFLIPATRHATTVEWQAVGIYRCKFVQSVVMPRLVADKAVGIYRSFV